MDGDTILLIVLIILVVMIPALMVYTVIVRGGERAREWGMSVRDASPAPSGVPARDAADKFSEGLRLLRSGDYPAAVQEFSAAITLDPDHWTAYFRRAEAYRKLGMEEQARGDLARAESIMGLARQEAEKRRTSSDFAVADNTGGAAFGCTIGAVVGIAAGLWCYYFFIICSPVFGVAGAIFGSIFGGFLGSKVRWFSDGCSAGCVGGCLGGAFGVIVVVGVGLLWLWWMGYI